jgi:hypothetical protein
LRIANQIVGRKAEIYFSYELLTASVIWLNCTRANADIGVVNSNYAANETLAYRWDTLHL